MRALTTKELAGYLVSKGYVNSAPNEIPENKWGANKVSVAHGQYNQVLLCKHTPSATGVCGTSKVILNYGKLKSAEKKEVQAFIESLPRIHKNKHREL